MHRNIPKRRVAQIEKFICRYLITRQELHGELESLPCGAIRVVLRTTRPLQAPRPIPVTDAQHAEILRLAREICGRFKFTVRTVPLKADNARAFELLGG